MTDNECRHTRKVEGHWAPLPPHLQNRDRLYDEDYDLEDNYEWVDSHEETLLVDLDLHRMKCSHCGAIKYYSQAARLYYEGETDVPPLGFDQAEGVVK